MLITVFRNFINIFYVNAYIFYKAKTHKCLKFKMPKVN